MTRYLVAALVVALVSVVVAALVLGGLYGWNPLHLAIVSGAGSANGVAERAAVATTLTSISTAVSTVFALIVGSIAVIAVIVAARSEAKSVEDLKLDFASLGGTLLSLRDRGLLYTNPALVDVKLDPFKAERESLARVLTGSTGFALYVWSKQPAHAEFADLYPGIAGLVNVTTLDLGAAFQPVANLVVRRAASLLRQLASIDRSQFKKMRRALLQMDTGLQLANDPMQRDFFEKFEQDFSRAQDEGIRAPTSQELVALQAMATTRIGGKSADMIAQFGEAAMTGSAEDRRRFALLVQELFNVTLDDLHAGVPGGPVAS